jgi:putative membrane protein
MELIIKWLVSASAIIISAYVIPGIKVAGFWTALWLALLLGLLNAIVRPVLVFLTLPINILTLGLFTFVINAVMLMMVSGVIGGFAVAGFGPALLGSLLISLVSWGLTSLVSERGTIEVIDLHRRGDNRWK